MVSTRCLDLLQEIRGSGLICGVQMDGQAGLIVEKAREMGVLVITAGAGDVVRLVPPLVCLDEEIDVVVEVLAECLGELS
jgi:acetylornithine/succinyldiaminopimelate/putrescine aminotransferase